MFSAYDNSVSNRVGDDREPNDFKSMSRMSCGLHKKSPPRLQPRCCGEARARKSPEEIRVVAKLKRESVVRAAPVSNVVPKFAIRTGPSETWRDEGRRRAGLRKIESGKGDR